MGSRHGTEVGSLHRLVDAPLPEFERLFEQPVEWSDATFPPGCRPRRGRLHTVLAPAGGLIVHVTRCTFEAQTFRLGALFGAGCCAFPTPRELFAFWNGELAAAFGIDVNVDIPDPRPAPEPDEPEPDKPEPDEPEPDEPEPDEPEPEGVADAEAPTPPTPRRRRSPEERRPRITAAALAEQLGRVVHGQPAALERLAHVVAVQLAKRNPARPGTVLLLGPTGSGKTSAVEALPAALAELGLKGAHAHRVDCNELTETIQVTRLLGAPPGYVGYAAETPLLEALRRRPCILLLDEVDRAHESVIQDVLLNLLDTGRLGAPDGKVVDAAHAVVALTSNLGVEELERRLHHVTLHNRWAVQEVCRRLLLDEGLPRELVARVSAFAVFRELDDEESLKAAAADSVALLAREYGLTPVSVDPLLADVLLDIAGRHGLGARALGHAAGELLGSAFAEAAGDGLSGRIVIETGPPISVRPP